MLKKLFRALSTGGVAVTITPPQQADLAAGRVLVDVSLRNNSAEPRFVHDVEFALASLTSKDDDGLQSYNITSTHILGIELPAGQQHPFSFEMPTSAPGLPTLPPTGSSYGYVLRATPRVEGFSTTRPRAISFGKGYTLG